MSLSRPLSLISVSTNLSQPPLKIDAEFETLKNILLQERYKEKKIVVFCTTGVHRLGKSFINGLFLRYFRSLDDGNNSTVDWVWAEGPILSSGVDGFHWRGGAERDTTGIKVWSEPFIVREPLSGEELVVLLMDTQGLWDNSTGARGDALIFALSTLISSVQMFNLDGHISEQDLDALEYFSKFAQIGQGTDPSDGSKTHIFQVLQLIVRDWQSAADRRFPYGSFGGSNYLSHYFNGAAADEILRRRRRNLNASFKELRCFLMPHPGDVVASENYKGALDVIDKEFLAHLRNFVADSMAPGRLVPKTAYNGRPMTCRDWFIYFETCAKVFNSDDYPSVPTLLEAMTESSFRAAVVAESDHYVKEIEKFCDPSSPLDAENLAKIHQKCLNEALIRFTSDTNYARESPQLQKFSEQLKANIERRFHSIKERNETMKNTKQKKEQTAFDQEKANFYSQRAYYAQEKADDVNYHAQNLRNESSSYQQCTENIKKEFEELREKRTKYEEKLDSCREETRSLQTQMAESNKKAEERERRHKNEIAKLRSEQNTSDDQIVKGIFKGIATAGAAVAGFVAGGPAGAAVAATAVAKSLEE